MGHKVHPYGFRVGILKPWLSRWYMGREYAKTLHEDLAIREFLKKQLDQALKQFKTSYKEILKTE